MLAKDREKFFDRVEVSATGCWLWVGMLEKDGYGRFYMDRRYHRAHRVAYQMFGGVIPDGLVLDHICRVRNCVNPLHLRVVTHKENILCGEGVPAKNARKTHCKRGHELSGWNLKIVPGGRACRECANAEKRARSKTDEYRRQAAAYQAGRRHRIAAS